MATTSERLLFSRIERASSQLVWTTDVGRSPSAERLYGSSPELSRPGGVVIHGLGVGRARAGTTAEVYCALGGASALDVRRAIGRSLGIPTRLVAIVECGAIVPHTVEVGGKGAHARLGLAGGYGTTGGVANCLLSGLLVAVSNNHVFADSNRGEQDDPLVDGSGRVFGGLQRFVRLEPQPVLNQVDGAIGWIRADETISTPVAISGQSAPSVGLRVHKFGATSGHTRGRIRGIGATAAPGYAGLGRCNFRSCLVVVSEDGPFSMPGDSGSLVLDEDDAVVGIVFAGSDDGSVTYANPVDVLTGSLSIMF
jgi:hypothetical protein